MLTIKDIASMANVSKSTVSRVINNTGYVNEDTRKRVEEIIRAHQYKPSAAAITLSKKVGNTIGVVIPEIDNSFFGELLKGINEIADEHGFSVICCDTQNSADKELKALSMLEQQQVRGVILTPASSYKNKTYAKNLKSTLDKLDVPTVIVDRYFDDCKWDTVVFENYQSGYIAAESIIKSGIDNIGIIQGDMNLKIAEERFRGYQQCLLDNNIGFDEQLVYEGDFSIETAYEITNNLILSKKLPKGLVSSNNRTSMGILKAASEHGLKIGKDFALVGIDHLPMMNILGVPFSCVTRDVIEMGRMSTNLLIERIDHKDTPIQTWVIPCQLHLKGSEQINI